MPGRRDVTCPAVSAVCRWSIGRLGNPPVQRQQLPLRTIEYVGGVYHVEESAHRRYRRGRGLSAGSGNHGRIKAESGTFVHESARLRNEQDYAGMPDVVPASDRHSGPGGEVTGGDGPESMMREFTAALPDFHVEVVEGAQRHDRRGGALHDDARGRVQRQPTDVPTYRRSDTLETPASGRSRRRTP